VSCLERNCCVGARDAPGSCACSPIGLMESFSTRLGIHLKWCLLYPWDTTTLTLRNVTSGAFGLDTRLVGSHINYGTLVQASIDVLNRATAEIAMALTFATKRRLMLNIQCAKEGSWGVWEPFQ
jgi:hypothetical protein